jgi:hypothetical protein
VKAVAKRRPIVRLWVCVAGLVSLLPAQAAASGLGYSNEFGTPGVALPFATCLVTGEVPCKTANGGGSCRSGDCLVMAPQYATDLFRLFVTNALPSTASQSYVRFSIPYDALLTRSTAGCTPSPFFAHPSPAYGNQTGLAMFGQLIWDVQGAQRFGLTPEVVITPGSGLGDPEYPDPVVGNGRTNVASWTQAGLDYRCGIYGILHETRALLGTDAVHQWEPLNEPDTSASYNGALKGICGNSTLTNPCAGRYNGAASLCDTRSVNRSCGPLEAAGLWEAFQMVINEHRWRGEQVAAMTLSRAQYGGWEAAYVAQLDRLYRCTGKSYRSAFGCAHWSYPSFWAVHDYDDVNAIGYKDLRAFEHVLSGGALRPARVWVTEAGNWLGSSIVFAQPADDNYPSGTTCLGVSPPTAFAPYDPAHTLNCLQQGNARNQQAGAQTWRGMLSVGAPRVKTTEAYWFEFQALPEWDSGLIDPHGLPRPSFCVLTGYPSCPGDLYFAGPAPGS